jgi:hypothetical protein
MEKKKRILDAATRKAMEGYLPFSSKQWVEHIPEKFISDKLPIRPVFRVRSLTRDEKDQIGALYSNLPKAREQMVEEDWVKIGEKLVDVYVRCLAGWDNFFDLATGEEISFDGSTRESWGLLPNWIQEDLREYIRLISCLTPVETLSLRSLQLSAQELSPLAAKGA